MFNLIQRRGSFVAIAALALAIWASKNVAGFKNAEVFQNASTPSTTTCTSGTNETNTYTLNIPEEIAVLSLRHRNMNMRLAVLNETVIHCDGSLKRFENLIHSTRDARKVSLVPEKDAYFASAEHILEHAFVETNKSCIDVAERMEGVRAAKKELEEKIKDLGGEGGDVEKGGEVGEAEEDEE